MLYMSGEDCPRGTRSELNVFSMQVQFVSEVFVFVVDLCGAVFFGRHMLHSLMCVPAFFGTCFWFR